MTGLIVDPAFDINRTEEYKLSIQVRLDGFSFSVVHSQKKQLLALDVLPVELSSTRFIGRHFKEWVQKNEMLQAKFHSTSIIYHPESLTFVPSEIYEFNHKEVIGRLVFGNQKDNLITENYLTDASGNLVFPVLKDLMEVLEQLFPGQKILHPATVLDHELSKLSDKKESTMVLYFGRKHFTLCLYANSQLKAVNNYNYVNAGDVVYYTIAAIKQLKLWPEKTSLFLAGEVLPNDEIHKSFKKIFNRIIFFIPDINYNSDVFKEPLHRFIVLF